MCVVCVHMECIVCVCGVMSCCVFLFTYCNVLLLTLCMYSTNSPFGANKDLFYSYSILCDEAESQSHQERVERSEASISSPLSGAV